MREKIKKYSGVIYIALITAAIVMALNYTNKMGNIYAALKSAKPKWLWMAAGCVALYLFFRMAILRFYLTRRGYRISWRHLAGITGVGQFYSAITPSSSGGQPMQVLWMHKLGVPAGVGTACVSVKFLGFQAAVLILGTVFGLAYRGAINAQIYGMRWLVVLGYIINAGLILLVVMTIPKTKIVDRMIGSVVRFGARIHLVKKPDKTIEHFQQALKDYRDVLVQLLHTPVDAAVILLLSLAQVFSYMAIIVCIYLALGLTGTRLGEILALQLLLFIAAAFIPLPGAAGAQESGFCFFFHAIIPDGTLMAAMVSWRFFSYYALMVGGMMMMIVGRTKQEDNTSLKK